IRALSTDVRAFPSLSIQFFDTEKREYGILLTDPQPLKVQPVEGKSFVSLDTYKDVRVSLVGQVDGIWHNYEANIMDDILNRFVAILSSGFWPIVICGPIAFVLLLPLVLDRRRRNMDARYRARMETFEAFKRLPEGDPGKWEAFQHFLAASFDSSPGAWTVEDSRRALRKIGASDDDIEKVVHLHQWEDARDFHPEHPPAGTVELNPLGKRILRLISKSALLLLCFFLIPDEATASDWSEAEKLFEQAIKAPAGSKDAMALYMDSALKFQSAAAAGERPGIAWYNAGNAWFRSGALGRSIAAYREARVYRPFDPLITENLIAVRSLTLTEMTEKRGLNSFWPGSWLKPLFAVVSVFFWILLLCYFRYRRRFLFITSCIIAVFGTGILGLLLLKAFRSDQQGVVIVEEVFARKGPSYSYEKAFTEPLQDGLEFTLREARDDWGLIELPDGRQCWTPLSQVQLLSF
ncbi:MAG: tetratricopeptide repeat protein, partial [Verrucomicrobiota bacterium]